MAAVAVLALIAGAVVAPSTASANHDPTLSIEVGHFFDGNGAPPAESMRFVAPNLTVHRGTILNFVGGFHTATALPPGTDVQDFVDRNVTAVAAPWSLFASDADDGGLANFKYNNNVIFPSGACNPASATCTFDGSEVANSGALFAGPPTGANMVIDVPAGETFWVICLVHPNMRMKVTVVDNATSTTTQGDIDAFAASTLEKDLDAATALHTKLLTRRSSHVAADGTRVHDVHAGFDTKNLALYDFYPSRSVVKRGQRVRYHFDTLEHEIHTVTFPRSFALEIASQDFVPMCDPDGPSGTGANTPATIDPVTGAPGCPAGNTLELQLSPGLLPDAGDGRVTSATDREHSGPRGLNLPSPPTHGADSYTVQFTKASNERGYSYDCAIHPFMRGTVVVKR
jgi:plastocyanin